MELEKLSAGHLLLINVSSQCQTFYYALSQLQQQSLGECIRSQRNGLFVFVFVLFLSAHKKFLSVKLELQITLPLRLSKGLFFLNF